MLKPNPNVTPWAKANKALHRWYANNGADYPFRTTPTPYTTWLSEIMLQQTRMNVVLPRFLEFFARYPTVESIAAVEEKDIVTAWQGLGYYTRARNIYRAAKQIIELHRGQLPTSYDELIALPGIGDYTASAISSIHFNAQRIVFDGNVRRITARLFRIAAPTSKDLVRLEPLFAGANQFGLLNQALMDLGRMICRPKPICDSCPLQQVCSAYQHSQTELFPQKKAKPAPIAVKMIILLIIDAPKKIFIKQHSGEAFLAGQEFPPFLTVTAEGGERYAYEPILWEARRPMAQPFHVTNKAFKHSITNHAIEGELHFYQSSDFLFDFKAHGFFTHWDFLSKSMVSSIGRKIQPHLLSLP